MSANFFIRKAIALDLQDVDPSVGAVVARPADELCYELTEKNGDIATLRTAEGEEFVVRASELRLSPSSRRSSGCWSLTPALGPSSETTRVKSLASGGWCSILRDEEDRSAPTTYRTPRRRPTELRAGPQGPRAYHLPSVRGSIPSHQTIVSSQGRPPH